LEGQGEESFEVKERRKERVVSHLHGDLVFFIGLKT
jgi:hypothetical protein